MRLIDADKVIQSVDRQISIARELLSNDPQYQEFISITEQCFKQEINNAPTVKAISVEWIENYISKMKDDGMIYLSSAGCIKDMLKEWEKENEID